MWRRQYLPLCIAKTGDYRKVSVYARALLCICKIDFIVPRKYVFIQFRQEGPIPPSPFVTASFRFAWFYSPPNPSTHTNTATINGPPHLFMLASPHVQIQGVTRVATPRSGSARFSEYNSHRSALFAPQHAPELCVCHKKRDTGWYWCSAEPLHPPPFQSAYCQVA